MESYKKFANLTGIHVFVQVASGQMKRCRDAAKIWSFIFVQSNRFEIRREAMTEYQSCISFRTGAQ